MADLRDALAAALHEECGAQHYIVNGTLPDGDETEWQECIGHEDDHLDDADALLARPPLAALLAVAEAAREVVLHSYPPDGIDDEVRWRLLSEAYLQYLAALEEPLP